MEIEDQIRAIADRHALDPAALADICGARSVEATEAKLRSYGSRPRKWTRRDLERIAAATGERIEINGGRS